MPPPDGKRTFLRMDNVKKSLNAPMTNIPHDNVKYPVHGVKPGAKKPRY